jgi:hypothetical protein
MLQSIYEADSTLRVRQQPAVMRTAARQAGACPSRERLISGNRPDEVNVADGSRDHLQCPLRAASLICSMGKGKKKNFESSRCVRFRTNENAIRDCGTTASEYAFARFYREH